MQTIGERIKNRRLELHLSADELADRLGKHRATVYRYESNDIENFPISVIEPLARALNVSPAYLMGWSEQKEIDDVYSRRFKKRLAEELATLDTDAFSGVPSAETDYSSLCLLSESDKSLSLFDACDAAGILGQSMSYMLMEGEKDSGINSETSDSENTESEDEFEIIRRVKKMGHAQRQLLLAALKIADEPEPGLPVSAPAVSADISEESV